MTTPGILATYNRESRGHMTTPGTLATYDRESRGTNSPNIELLLLSLKCEQNVKTFNVVTCVASHTVFVIGPCILLDPEVIL